MSLKPDPAAPLPPARRQAVLGAIVALHAALGWALLQGQTLRLSPMAPPPLLVSLLSAPEPAVSTSSALTPVPRPVQPTAPVLPPTVVPEIQVQAPAPAAPMPTARPEPASPPETPQRQAVAAVAVAGVSNVVAAPPPVQIPASAVQYLVLPDVRYPAASRRLNESGLVVVAVFVDATGLPQDVRLDQSSGFERLDRAALAGVRLARFKPFVLDGRPTAGWARIPIPFELER